MKKMSRAIGFIKQVTVTDAKDLEEGGPNISLALAEEDQSLSTTFQNGPPFRGKGKI